MKKVIASILVTLTLTLFALSIYIIIVGTIANKKQELFYLFGYSYGTVPSESMVGEKKDNFNPGDIVIIKNVSFDELSEGDIIVYKSNVDTNRLIIHRIIEKHNDYYITKGDNNPTGDYNDPVTITNYQGKYIGHINFISFNAKVVNTVQLLL